MIHAIHIKNGKIIDGTGNPWYSGDLAIADERICAIGKLKNLSVERIIDATGMVVAPGFIDAHSHNDFNSLVYRQMESTVMQGITTVVAGQCGLSLAPVNPEKREYLEKEFSSWLPPEVDFKVTWRTFDEYLKEEEREGLGANIAHLIGHGTIRTSAMGLDNRKPTSDELKIMKELTAEGMKAGAYGLSTGLIYPPGIYAQTEEISELAKVVASYGGVYCSHIRGEGGTLLKAVEEAISIGEKADLPVQISHHKASTKKAWGKSVDTLQMIEEARERGVDVTVDQYPYNASSTSLATLLPPWVHDGGTEELLERLKNAESRKKIRSDMEGDLPDRLGWENIFVTYVRTEANKAVEGKNMLEINEMRGDPDIFTSLFNLLLEEEAAAQMVTFTMKEDDIVRIMQHPLQMIGTDSSGVSPTGPFSKGKPHPRHYGTYPRILGRYVREKRVLRLEEAIRKMTSLPAQRFGISDRGLIRTGMYADITIFDPETVIDKATYAEPHQFPEGISYVIINGKVAVDNGRFAGILAGKTLRANHP